MGERTALRFAAAGVEFELRGPEEFVRRHLETFLPLVEHATRGASPGSVASASDASDGLTAWFAENVDDGARLTLQDAVLVFALWMRSFKKYIFTAEDIRRAFADVGRPEPRSLLQILGSLKRDHNLILGTERRGEYMLNTTGIERARNLAQGRGAER